MSLPNIFSKQVSEQVIARINKLTPSSKPAWGKMNVSQMLAHCNVSYEMSFENKHPKPKGFMKLVLRYIIKGFVTNEKPYKPNTRTAPAFIISDSRDFEHERKRLIGYIERTQQLGEEHFHNRPSHSFGPLKKSQWSNMFYKHLDHHLKQFGV